MRQLQVLVDDRRETNQYCNRRGSDGPDRMHRLLSDEFARLIAHDRPALCRVVATTSTEQSW